MRLYDIYVSLDKDGNGMLSQVQSAGRGGWRCECVILTRRKNF